MVWEDNATDKDVTDKDVTEEDAVDEDEIGEEEGERPVKLLVKLLLAALSDAVRR